MSTTRELGPQQQRTARTGAQHIRYWAGDLEKAIQQNDVEAAAKLLTAITDQAAATAKLVKGARKVGA